MILVSAEDFNDIHIRVTTEVNMVVVIRYKPYDDSNGEDEVINGVTNVYWKPKRGSVFIRIGDELCMREIKLSRLYWLSFDKTVRKP